MSAASSFTVRLVLSRAARRRAACLAGPMALAALVGSRGMLEASMLRHMTVQLPLLVACGALCRPWLSHAATWRAQLAACDTHGLAGMTASAFVLMYWMIPRALEQSLATPAATVLKFASLLVLGLVLPGSLGRAHAVVQLFFVANVATTMAIAGMLYQQIPQRLCNTYLLDDQVDAGQALVWLAVALGASWCALQARSLNDEE